MGIDGVNNSGIPNLRLTGAPAAQRSASAPPAPPTGRTEPTDSYSFEAVYRNQLPRVPMTDAHQRLEQMRNLVAGRVDVPIHFDNPQPPGGPAANPYAAAYLKFPTDPATLNERASDAHRDR